MKLRNRETGVIGELHYNPEKEYCFTIATEDPADMMIYMTIGGIWYDWEDYIPTEPLIKDEKIRKAVRAWAEANGIDSSSYCDKKVKFNTSEHRLTWIDTSIEFDEITGLENLKNRRRYTIAELCGEEEE